jgi:hypothetical protein
VPASNYSADQLDLAVAMRSNYALERSVRGWCERGR